MAGMAPDPLFATRERLRRLEQLRAEGILTDEEYAAKRAAILDGIVATAASVTSPTPTPIRSAMRAEIERRTRHGWQVASEAPDGVQLRKPKHFSFGWALLWFVLAVFPFVVYLLWHWAKRDRYVYLTLNADGSVTSSDSSLLGRLVAGYWRWSSSRSQPWQKALALAGPPAVVALAVVALAVSGGGGSSGTTNNTAASHSGGQPNAPGAVAIPTATARRLAIGDTWHAISDGWDITVDDVTTTKAIQGGILGLPHVATGVYLAVAVKMLNTGTGAHALGDNRFKLVNAAGQSYGAAAFDRSYGGGSYNEDISSGTDVTPGESLDGLLFFDVPSTVSGLQLKVIGGGVFALGDVRDGRFAMSTAAPARSDTISTAAANGSRSGPRILHLRAGDIAESEALAGMRSYLLDPVAANSFCKPLAGLTAPEVTTTLRRAASSEDHPLPTVQVANPADELRYAEIVVQECDRTLKALG